MRLTPIVLSVALGVAFGGCDTSHTHAPPASAATFNPTPAGERQSATSPSVSTAAPGIASAGDIGFELPAGWRQLSMAEFRAELVRFREPLTGPERATVDQGIEAIDSGRTRIAAVGPTKGATGSIFLSVDEGVDATLPEAAARLFKEQSPFIEPNGPARATAIFLPIGPAVRLAETHEPPASAPGGIPSRTVQYVTRLRDGRTIWILGTAPASDDTFEAVMKRVAETLATS
jgi:hypothetical protein